MSSTVWINQNEIRPEIRDEVSRLVQKGAIGIIPATYASGLTPKSADLRDYFAAHALQGLIAKGMNDGSQWDTGYIEQVAALAYQYADALFTARTR